MRLHAFAYEDRLERSKSGLLGIADFRVFIRGSFKMADQDNISRFPKTHCINHIIQVC